MALVPLLLRATGFAASGAVGLLPLICGLGCAAWTWLDLPHADRPTGKRIGGALWQAALCSLLLAGAAALLAGSWMWCVWLLDALAVAGAWAHRALGSRLARRYLRTFCLVMPVFAHYRLLAWWAEHAGLSEEERGRALEELHGAYAGPLVDRLAELGGLFVKLGQLLSLFSNLGIPAAYLRELKRLQGEVPAMPAAQARRLLAEALGGPPEAVFSRFEEEPVGAASLGQVHRARLAVDGREVAVKLQFASAAETLELDFAWIEWLVAKLKPEALPVAREVREAFLRELDYTEEARTLQRVHASMREAFPEVNVPAPVLELCAPTLIVMTFVPGVSVLDSLLRFADLAARLSGKKVEDLFAAAGRAATELKPGEEVENAFAGVAGTGPEKGIGGMAAACLVGRLAALRAYQAAVNVGVDLYNLSAGHFGAETLDYCQIMPSFNPVKVSRTAWQVQGHQLFVDGFFNTDSHPGNFLIDPRTGNVGLIDFGQVCEISLETRIRFARLVVALAKGDEAEIALQHARLGMRTRCMRTEQLALHARMKYGRITTAQAMDFGRRLAVLDGVDPVLSAFGDEKMALVEKMIALLRGTNVFLGVLGKHSAQTMWRDLAERLLAEHGARLPEEPLELDLDLFRGGGGLPGGAPGGAGGAPAPLPPGGPAGPPSAR